MEPYIGLFLIIILLAIAIYTLYQDASIVNLISSFLLLSFIGYFTIYIIDTDFTNN